MSPTTSDRPSTGPGRRTPGGALDLEHYYRRAREERAEFLRHLIASVLACLATPVRCLRERLAFSRRKRVLAGLSSREMRDLGITRGDIDALSNGCFYRDTTRRPRQAAMAEKAA